MQTRRLLTTLLRTRLASALVTPHSVDDYLQLAAPTWSVRSVRARVTGLSPEADGAVSLWLLPNANWSSFRAGQFVQLSVRLNGVRHTRCFSLSSAPEDGIPIRLTIKAVPEGRVSAWSVREARPGDVLELSRPMGEFVLPEPVPQRLLFISGGSGITPIVSLIRHLVARGYTGRVVCLHYARRDVILGDEILELARRLPGLELAIRWTQPTRTSGASGSRFSREGLEVWLPEWRDYETFASGPGPLLEAVASLWHRQGLARGLHLERFSASLPERPSAGAEYRLVFAKSGREARGHQGASLLQQAEGAGLAPAYGCRMGICHTCKCIKRSGVVRNELTGAIDDGSDSPIQLCITTPRSDVTLEL